MKIALIGDVHWSETSSILRRYGDKYTLRLENLIKSVQWAEDTAVQNNCDQIIYLGDFFDRADLRAAEITALKEIKWNALPHKFLLGNHEIGGIKEFYNSVNALSSTGKIIDKPEIETGDTWRIIYLPYIEEKGRLPITDYISEIEDADKSSLFTILLSHNDIKGINYGIVESTKGFSISDMENNCNICINGHIHNRGYVSDSVLNIGNLTGQNFGEDGFEYSHGILILDTDEVKLTAYDNPNAIYFYKVEINSEKDIGKLHKISNDAVVAIRCKEEYVLPVRTILMSKSNILESRITLIPSQNSNDSAISQVELVNVDHIALFNNFIIEQLGNSNIVKEELQEISK